ncbi:hypothetical protein L2E82_07834 [Cichorium intybus]|uniref:Uncharacterized protein n=1 Tax=Cichorium intybus TaxID=13427 RepID=A0ACB9G4Z9_CICIN|nr:hypothetical protein L2E82_07834 [Cichorium intybus]
MKINEAVTVSVEGRMYKIGVYEIEDEWYPFKPFTSYRQHDLEENDMKKVVTKMMMRKMVYENFEDNRNLEVGPQDDVQFDDEIRPGGEIPTNMVVSPIDENPVIDRSFESTTRVDETLGVDQNSIKCVPFGCFFDGGEKSNFLGEGENNLCKTIPHLHLLIYIYTGLISTARIAF